MDRIPKDYRIDKVDKIPDELRNAGFNQSRWQWLKQRLSGMSPGGVIMVTCPNKIEAERAMTAAKNHASRNLKSMPPALATNVICRKTQDDNGTSWLVYIECIKHDKKG